MSTIEKTRPHHQVMPTAELSNRFNVDAICNASRYVQLVGLTRVGHRYPVNLMTQYLQFLKSSESLAPTSLKPEIAELIEGLQKLLEAK